MRTPNNIVNITNMDSTGYADIHVNNVRCADGTYLSQKAHSSIVSTVDHDLNDFSNGVHIIYNPPERNNWWGLPTGWYQLITVNDSGTGVQTAFGLYDGIYRHRYLAGGNWSNFTNSIYQTPIQYKDVSITIATANWITSAKGQKYFNSSTFSSLGISGIVMGCFISSWSGTQHLVTCSPYENTRIQFRAETATDWIGTVRIFYF